MKPLVCFLLLGTFALAQPVDVVRSRVAEDTLSLNGAWKFQYHASSEIGAAAGFPQPGFDDRAWATLPVPAHWELHGFAEPNYKKVDEGTGLYRREFLVPAGWPGGRILLRFEGVQYGFTAWVNGREIGSWASSYNPVTFDITDAVQRGAANTLAVRVTTRSKGWEFDLNDCWALSGIYREVTLLHVPTAHLRDYTTRTTLRPDGSAELQVAIAATGSGAVNVHVTRADGKIEASGQIVTGSDGSGEARLVIQQPQLWTAETPALYGLELEYAADGSAPHRIAERIGLREVSIVDGVLRLNGRAIKLRGVDHHDIWPDAGRVATEELLRRDLEMMRAANINFVRTSHYPPHPRLVELCDELGLYVMCEVPFGHGDKNLTDPTFEPVLRMRARATVTRDKNRPSVIVWSIGNENPLTDLGVKTALYTRQLDPTRPVCIPTVGSYFAAHLEKFKALPPEVGIFAPHYPGRERAEDYAQHLGRPVIFTEFSHALGLAFDGTETLWKVFEKSPRIAGGAVWMFQDQGIKRAVAPGGPPKNGAMYVWPDAAHYYDTAGTDGCDGIVYADRTPQADYWQLRKVYAPVRLSEHSVSVQTGAQQIRLHVENLHDFRSLHGLRLRWTLRLNGAALATGETGLSAPAQTTEPVMVPVTVPAGAGENFCWLEVSCLDESGRALTEQSVRLKTAASAPAEKFLAAPAAPAELKLIRTGSLVRAVHPQFAVELNRDTGALRILGNDGRALVAGIGPHAGRRFTLAETLRIERERRDTTESALRDGVGSIWAGVESLPATLEHADATLEAGVACFTVRGRYLRLDRRAQALTGEHVLEVSPGGRITVRYAYTPSGDGTMIEAGLGLAVPAPASEFRWVGAGPFAGYPGKEALNEFGRHHLTARDLRFNGNRRGVHVMALSAVDGAGVVLLGEAMDVAVETIDSGVMLSHNVAVAGRGNKGGSPETQIHVTKMNNITGRFTLLPLGRAWPEALVRWLGPPDASVPAWTPFFKSYDQ